MLGFISCNALLKCYKIPQHIKKPAKVSSRYVFGKVGGLYHSTLGYFKLKGFVYNDHKGYNNYKDKV